MTKIAVVYPIVIIVTDGLVVIVELLINQKYIIMFSRKKTIDYRNIRMKNKQNKI
jgi:hypothetical protein